MLDTLSFWLLAEAIGLIGLPFAAASLARLPGGGLAFARPLGLLLVAYPLWLLVSLDVLRFSRPAAVAATVAVAAVALPVGARVLGPAIRRPGALRLWLAGEALFTLAFFGWAILRSFSPEIVQTEKPMDMAIVNAVDRSGSFPPHDPWFSGAHLNYYYFGHYIVAFLIRIAGVDPARGYNLAVALFFALSAAAVFAIASALYLAVRGKLSAVRAAVAAGFAASGLAIAGNIAGAIDYLHHPGRIGTYDWFAPSRVILNTANEFPFFSFLLGDLHAHVMAIPFALTALGFTLQVCVAGPPPAAGRSLAGARAASIPLLLGALALGSLYAINGLDYPTAVALSLIGLILWALEHPASWRSTLTWGILWLGSSLVLFLPFWSDFTPTTHGLGVVRERTHFSTFLENEFLIYGLFLWIVVSLVAGRRRLPVRYLVWGGVAAAVLLVLLSPPRLASVLVGLAVGAVALYLSLAGERPQAERFLWLLVAAGLTLVGVSEFVYIRDSFDGTESFRFNTVFKAGYQAWFLLSIVAGCLVVWNRIKLKGPLRRLWWAGLVCLAALALVYPVVASYSRSRGFAPTPTLDGMAWLERTAPGDAAGIEWLRSNARMSATVLEAVGPDFDPAGTARVSTFTGLPTVLGWAGHEIQWGHDPGTRGADVQQIYRTRDIRLARRLLDRYDVRYVFVGSLERQRYPGPGLGKFGRLGRRVFSQRGAAVYLLPPS